MLVCPDRFCAALTEDAALTCHECGRALTLTRPRTRDGYRQVRLPKHPLANRDGYIYVHRWIMRDQLADGLIVHHDNEDKSDNRPENLVVMTPADHTRLHWRRRRDGGASAVKGGNLG